MSPVVTLHELMKKRLKGCQTTRSSASFAFQVRFLAIFLLHPFILNSAQAAEPTGLFRPDSACSRSFIYRNRTYPVDSSRKQDGEGLRFLFKKNLDSEALLNDYQSQIKASFIPAYVGTFGILLAAIGGGIYASSLQSELGQRDTRNVLLPVGLLLTIGGYAYGQYAIKEKEKTLEKAVKTYNDAVPELERIRIELTPLPSGNGGEIKTQVPF